MQPGEGRNRVVVEGVTPEIDSGKYPIKRIVGDNVVIEADIIADGHDALSCALLYRKETGAEWSEVPMEPLVNDRWRGTFTVQEIGRYRYTVCAWVDRFKSWSRDLAKRVQAGQDVTVDLLIGARDGRSRLQMGDRDAGGLAGNGRRSAACRRGGRHTPGAFSRVSQADGPPRRAAFRYYIRQRTGSRGRSRTCPVRGVVRAISARRLAVPGRHGTLKDVEERLQYVAAMGFDVLYLPPIDPMAAASAKVATIQPLSVKMTWVAPGPSDRPREDTKRFTRS